MNDDKVPTPGDADYDLEARKKRIEELQANMDNLRERIKEARTPKDKYSHAGCLGVLVLLLMSVLASMYTAFIIHKVWQWHFAAMAQPWPTIRIWLLGSVVQLYFHRSREMSDRERAMTLGEYAYDKFGNLLGVVVFESLFFLFAWWAS